MALVELNLQPTRRELRQFAWICLAGLLLVGLILRWRWGLHTAPMVLWILGPAIAVIGLVVPAALKPLYIGLMVITYPIGWVVSHVTLAIAYYVVLTGLGLIFRAIGRDPLQRKFDRNAATYWIPRRPTTDVKRYFQQF